MIKLLPFFPKNNFLERKILHRTIKACAYIMLIIFLTFGLLWTISDYNNQIDNNTTIKIHNISTGQYKTIYRRDLPNYGLSLDYKKDNKFYPNYLITSAIKDFILILPIALFGVNIFYRILLYIVYGGKWKKKT